MFFTLLATVFFLEQTRCVTIEKKISKEIMLPFFGNVFTTFTQKKNLHGQKRVKAVFRVKKPVAAYDYRMQVFLIR